MPRPSENSGQLISSHRPHEGRHYHVAPSAHPDLRRELPGHPAARSKCCASHSTKFPSIVLHRTPSLVSRLVTWSSEDALHAYQTSAYSCSLGFDCIFFFGNAPHCESIVPGRWAVFRPLLPTPPALKYFRCQGHTLGNTCSRVSGVDRLVPLPLRPARLLSPLLLATAAPATLPRTRPRSPCYSRVHLHHCDTGAGAAPQILHCETFERGRLFCHRACANGATVIALALAHSFTPNWQCWWKWLRPTTRQSSGKDGLPSLHAQLIIPPNKTHFVNRANHPWHHAGLKLVSHCPTLICCRACYRFTSRRDLSRPPLKSPLHAG